MRRISVLLPCLFLCLLLPLAGCHAADPASERTAAWEPTAPAAPTPSPTPRIAYGPAELVPDGAGVALPAFYTALRQADGSVCYGFIDQSGALQYRAVARRSEYTDGVATGAVLSVYPAACDGDGVTLMGEQPVRPEEERPGVFVAQALPDELRPRRGFTETDLPGLLYQEDEALYAAYGTMGDAEDAAFYPADAAGTVEAGALPLARICAVPAYTPGDRPKQEGYLKLVVYIPTQSVVAYRAIDNEWIIERVMTCSSGRSRNITPRGTFGIQVKYPLKRLGTPGDYCYGQYACRFTGPFLFHSVPISYDADNDVTLARRMMFMEKYEQLGTPASDGCIRLTVADAKWIFDNSVIYDTRVVLTDDAGPIPPTPPPVIWEAPYTDENGLGWDPTDPDPDNPYLQLEAYANPSCTPSPAEVERARLAG